MTATSSTLGILSTDAVREELRSVHGDYPAMFRALLLQAGMAMGSALAFRDFDVRAGEYPERVEDCDAYLITGSRHSVCEDAAWIRQLEGFVREVHGRRHKLIGVCFGHQVMARALAGPEAAGEVGWVVGAERTRVRERRPWMQPFQGCMRLLASHRDQVLRLPDGATWLLEGERCRYAGFGVGDHLVTCQGHPEFTLPYLRGLLDLRREQLGEALWRQAYASLASPLDQLLMGRWLLNFLDWHETLGP